MALFTTIIKKKSCAGDQNETMFSDPRSCYYLYSLKCFQRLKIPDESNKATKVGVVKLCYTIRLVALGVLGEQETDETY